MRVSDEVSKLWQARRVHEAFEIIEQREICLYRNDAYYLLQNCMKRKDLECGRKLKVLLAQNGLDSVSVLGDNLVRMFASRGCLCEANEAFNNVSQPSIYTWSSIILANADLGQGQTSVHLYTRMKISGLKNDSYVIVAALKACTATAFLAQAREIHSHIKENHFPLEGFIANALIDSYAKSGSLEESCRVFDLLLNPDVVAWNTLIAAYGEHGQLILALDCFEQMQEEGARPSRATFSCVLKLCAALVSLGQGRLIHGQILEFGLELDIIVGSTLVDMYAKCDSWNESCKVFEKLVDRDVVSWNSLITAYMMHDNCSSALDCFTRMQEESIKPDEITFLSVLKACASITNVTLGRLLHVQILNQGLGYNVLGNSLIEMYAECDRLEESCKIFQRLSHKCVISWTVLITGYVQHGEALYALGCFEEMLQSGIEPDRVTFLSILKACANAGTIHYGRHIHNQVLQHRFGCDLVIANTLIDMYAKCGSIEDSRKLFDLLPNRDVATWSTMIGGYALHGDGHLALNCFNMMQEAGTKPNEVTFLCILLTCSHAGLVNRGRWHFKHMEQCHSIMPNEGHYICMVDLLGRAGHLKEAEDLLQVHEQSSILGLRSLLNASLMHGDIELGKRCFHKLIHLDPCNAPGYVLMSNIYADA